MYEHVVVALDGSPEAEAILPYVQELATKFGSRITLVHVNMSEVALVASTSTDAASGLAPAITDPTPIIQAEHESTDAYLRQLAARVSAAGGQVEWVALEGSPSQQVADFAREHNASLIALTTHGRAGLERALFGSVADSILRHTDCPVLMVRLHEPASS